MSNHIADVACDSSHQLTIAPCKRSTLLHRLLVLLTRPLPCPCRRSAQHTPWSLAHPTVVLELSSSHTEPQPDEARQLQLLFSPHYTHGHFVATLNCGIIAGLGPLWEHEGMEVVAGCVDSILEDPASRSDLIFYDKGCALRRYRLHHPDDSWFGTRHLVDR